MTVIDAVHSQRVFKPADRIDLPENQPVRLTVEAAPANPVSNCLATARTFQQQVVDRRGFLPDSTPDIAADRQRHE